MASGGIQITTKNTLISNIKTMNSKKKICTKKARIICHGVKRFDSILILNPFDNGDCFCDFKLYF
jgi:hypothetical protein